MSYLVYLSGPISGLTFAECTEWRRRMADQLEDYDLEVLDPMRDVTAPSPDTLIDELVLGIGSVDASMLSDRGIMVRDHHDTCRADLLVINLLGAKKASIGTVAELAWAYDRNIPTIVLMENDGNVHDHPFVREMTSYRVDHPDRAMRVVLSVLGLRDW